MFSCSEAGIRHAEDLLERLSNLYYLGRDELPIDVNLIGNKKNVIRPSW